VRSYNSFGSREIGLNDAIVDGRRKLQSDENFSKDTQIMYSHSIYRNDLYELTKDEWLSPAERDVFLKCAITLSTAARA
jgi:hypothetical protein